MKIENLSIGIVCGGFSNEREISLRGAQSIHQTLIAKNINSRLIDIRDKNEMHDKKMYDGIDFALVMIHGKGGEDGEVQEFLSSLNIKFSGSDISGLKNSYDKVLAKQIWRENKINTPQYVSDIFDWSDLPDFLKKTSKLVIKPSKEGSSLGVSIIKNNSTLSSGDIFAINAPYNGGTHLPDITIVNPIWNSEKSEIIFYTAARGHHTDIGGLTPGSMPCNSKDINEEGIYIDNWKIVDKGIFREKEIKEKLLSGSYPARSPLTNIADLKAQIAACKKGEAELLKVVDKYGLKTVFRFQELVCQNAENAVRESIKTIKSTKVTYQMDNDLSGAVRKIQIKLRRDKNNSSIEVDFNGTTMQLESNYNAPLPVTRAAVLYAFRILTGGNIPMNSGIMKPIKLKVPKASMLSPEYPAAVIAGNVETSQAVTSALLIGFGLQAASQSTMNNITWGNKNFQYYETICGGTGAGIDFSGSFYEGTSAVHSHMTNSRLTDPETLEFRYPVILEEFSIRKGSGGVGQYHGGDGVVRRISFLEPMIISVLSGHRTIGPPGLLGGGSGKVGSTSLMRNSGSVEVLKYADQIEGKKGDILVVKTPGGGGLGKSPQ